jgi:hypothetical protein
VVLRHEYFFDCYCKFSWAGHCCCSD